MYFMTWISLVIVSLGLIFLGRWVKDEVKVYALIGLVVIEVSLIMVLSNLS